MNRHNRRKTKHPVGNLVTIYRGTLSQHDPNYGLKVICYVCAAPHLAHGLAGIQDKSGTTHVPLCNQCLGSDQDVSSRILKKYWDTPDLEVSEGGELTDEQLLALEEAQGSVRQ